MFAFADQCRMFFERDGIMEALRQYLLSVTAAAILCSIVMKLLGKKGTASSVGKMLTGLFLAFTVMSPFAKLEIGKVSDFTNAFEADAADAVAAGQNHTRKAMAEIIKSQSEAYILDKAKALGVELTVEVAVSEADIPIPTAVRLKGKVSPYVKSQLQTAIKDGLGILKENQIWI